MVPVSAEHHQKAVLANLHGMAISSRWLNSLNDSEMVFSCSLRNCGAYSTKGRILILRMAKLSLPHLLVVVVE